MFNQIEKLASAIKNDVLSGIKGYHSNISISDELLCLDIVDERLLIIKEYSLKGILPAKDLYLSINCIPVDCKNIEKCRCSSENGTPTAHFEIPQILVDFESRSIEYLGTIDKQTSFIYYTSPILLKTHKHRKRGKNKPYVWIDTTPNENGLYDCFIFNAPFLELISITAIFKDPRQLDFFGCCTENSDDNFSFINNEIKKRLTEKKIRYYKVLAMSNTPNDQTYQ